MASVWKDCKLVYVMSTNSDPQEDASVQWKDRDGTSHLVPCPQNVVVYNKFMGGVDRADQLRHYYRVRCKTRKFYRYIFWFVFDSAVVNSSSVAITCPSQTPVCARSTSRTSVSLWLLGLLALTTLANVMHCHNQYEKRVCPVFHRQRNVRG